MIYEWENLEEERKSIEIVDSRVIFLSEVYTKLLSHVAEREFSVEEAIAQHLKFSLPRSNAHLRKEKLIPIIEKAVNAYPEPNMNFINSLTFWFD